MTTLRIDTGHCGFPNVAHGGYLSGLLAAHLGSASATVRLRRPVRPGADYDVEHTDGMVILSDGDGPLADARRWTPDLDVPHPIDAAAAERAGNAVVPQRDVIPTCFACGLGREPGESLRLAVGPVASNLAAGLWTPHPHLALADGTLPDTHVWAALDCPALWAMHLVAGGKRQRLVTGSLSAVIHGRVSVGEPYILLGWPIQSRRAGAAIFSTDGTLVAAAVQLCVQTAWGFPTGGNFAAE